jgi:hypothetical protein
MRRTWSLLAVALTAAGLTVGSTAAANALGGESLGCRVVPVLGSPPFTQFCTNHEPARTYGVGFLVSGLSGAYNFAWQLPPGYTPVSGFCGNSDQCAINVRNADQSIRVTVTLTQNGASETLYSEATINAFCGNEIC